MVASAEYTCQRMSWLDAWSGGIQILSKHHWIEAGDHGYDRVDVDVDAYDRLDRAGVLRVYVVQHGPDIIGYGIWVCVGSLQHRGRIHAYSDATYVSPQHRGTASILLLRTAEREIRADGIRRIYQVVRENSTKHGRLLEWLGYEIADYHYSKEL